MNITYWISMIYDLKLMNKDMTWSKDNITWPSDIMTSTLWTNILISWSNNLISWPNTLIHDLAHRYHVKIFSKDKTANTKTIMNKMSTNIYRSSFIFYCVWQAHKYAVKKRGGTQHLSTYPLVKTRKAIIKAEHQQNINLYGGTDKHFYFFFFFGYCWWSKTFCVINLLRTWLTQ